MKPLRRADRSLFGTLIISTGLIAGATVLAAGSVASVMARMVVTPPRRRAADVHVLGVDEPGGRIMLAATADTAVPGRYGLWFGKPERYLQLGDVLRADERVVERELPAQDLRGVVGHGIGTFSGWVYTAPEDTGVPAEAVLISTPGGPAPAWEFPPPADAPDGRWAVVVHGRGTTRSEGLRAVPTLHAAGYRVLIVSYRNDGEGPLGEGGLYGLGLTEWRDVEAALDYAAARGARSITLMGWSMGGAIALQTTLESAHRGLIDGLILESPVIDWRRVLDYQGGERGLPRSVRRLATELLGARWARPLTGLEKPLDLNRLDLVSRAAELSVPTLVLHSDDDGFVPSNGSRALAEARPDLVRLEVYTVARHTKLWNYDRERWERSIAAFVDALPGGRGAADERE